MRCIRLYFLSGYSFDFLFQALVPACFISIYYSIEVRHGLISKQVRDNKKGEMCRFLCIFFNYAVVV